MFLIKSRQLFNEIYTDKASLKKLLELGLAGKMMAILE